MQTLSPFTQTRILEFIQSRKSTEWIYAWVRKPAQSPGTPLPSEPEVAREQQGPCAAQGDAQCPCPRPASGCRAAGPGQSRARGREQAGMASCPRHVRRDRAAWGHAGKPSRVRVCAGEVWDRAQTWLLHSPCARLSA